MSYLVEKFDEHVAQPFGDWVADNVSAETCVAVSESKACAAVEKTAQVTFKASTMALDVLCPGSATCQATENVAVNGGSLTDLGKAAINDFGGKKLNMAMSAVDTVTAAVDGDLKGAALNATGIIPGGKGKSSSRLDGESNPVALMSRTLQLGGRMEKSHTRAEQLVETCLPRNWRLGATMAQMPATQRPKQ